MCRLFAQTGAGPLIMNHFHFRKVDNLIPSRINPIAKINIFAIEKVGFVPAIKLLAQLGGHHHKGTSNHGNIMGHIKVFVRLKIVIEFWVVGKKTA